MGFKVHIDDLRAVNEYSNQKILEWSEEIESVYKSMEKLVKLESFQGKTAESVKAYYSEIHSLLISAIITALNDFRNKYLLYYDGYSEIDSDKHAKLNEDIMYKAKQEYNTSLCKLEDIQLSLKNTLSNVSDIFGMSVPGTGSLVDYHEEAIHKIQTTIDKVDPYEQQHLSGNIKQLEDLINNTRAYVKEYVNADRNIMSTYVSGDYMKDENIYALAVSMQASSQFNKENAEALQNAADHQKKVYKELQEEYEAAIEADAAQRADMGVAQMLMGGAAVILGGAAIILTAGAATPVVVTAAVAGGSTILYGTAEIIEGGQHTYYGVNGDPYTSAFNPVRDTVFGGNQDAYATWGDISMMVASICIPVANTTKGLTGVRAVKAGGIAITKEGGEELVEEMLIKPYITEPISEKIASATGLDDSATGQLIINVATDTAIGGIVDSTAGKYVDEKLDYQYAKIESEQVKVDMTEKGGFSGMMDDADAERYKSGKQNDLEVETNEIRRDAEASGKGLSGLMDEKDAKRFDEVMNSGEKPQKVIDMEEKEAEAQKKADSDKLKKKMKESIPKYSKTIADNSDVLNNKQKENIDEK